MEKVSIGVPCYGPQEAKWWASLVQIISYSSKTLELGEIIVSDSMATDHNRNTIVDTFLKSKSDWLFWIDADTTVPAGSIERLLKTGKKVISGLYYAKNFPHNPILYNKHMGAFAPLPPDAWERGEIIRVDMAGMGCMLIHRSVFEDIKDKYVAKQEVGGGLILVHKDDIHGEEEAPPELNNQVYGNVIYKTLTEQTTNLKFPFFSLEHGKTEDVWFCEKLERLGYQIYVDTSVECGHISPREYVGKDYRELYGH